MQCAGCAATTYIAPHDPHRAGRDPEPSGTYYLETGYGIRPSKVIYDRKHSAITEYDFSQVDLDALLDGFNWLHLSGITPALAPNCRSLILDMLKVAKRRA